ncbi:MAG TPA: hypothetical protein PK867_32035, partial [Pirellulales bacterium]|nr:hypothetical protein [Pirellulales bacterium]
DYKLVTGYESLRKKLLTAKFNDRLDKPLAYWVIGSDRRLPLAFMGRTLRDLLNTPFDELFATAGIGQKKIRTFLMLLNRAAQPKPIGALADEEETYVDTAAEAAKEQPNTVDASLVSEALWVRWSATVRKHRLENEPLGRFAANLLDMPRVVWYRPLGEYVDLSLAQLRALRTHGEKRVRAVLDVFGNLHQLLVHVDPDSHLGVRVGPRSLMPVEDWVVHWLTNVGIPSKRELQDSLVAPLLEQVRIDAGAPIAKLAEGRLQSQSGSVRRAAHRMGLTRARVYQLLSEASEVLVLRWPAGPALVGQLRNKMQAAEADGDLLAWFDLAIELLLLRSSRHDESDEEDLPSNGRSSQPSNGASPKETGRHRNGQRSTAKTAPRRRG